VSGDHGPALEPTLGLAPTLSATSLDDGVVASPGTVKQQLKDEATVLIEDSWLAIAKMKMMTTTITTVDETVADSQSKCMLPGDGCGHMKYLAGSVVPSLH